MDACGKLYAPAVVSLGKEIKVGKKEVNYPFDMSPPLVFMLKYMNPRIL
jgi:hypothetical protein